jgi:hypothetical protein
MSTRTPDCSYGAIPTLLWTARKLALANGRIFYFDGAINENAVKFFLISAV